MQFETKEDLKNNNTNLNTTTNNMNKKSANPKQTQQPRRSNRVKMAAKAKTRFNKDLPVVLLKRAFTFLSVRSIDGSVKCCKDWNVILTDPNEWSQQWDDDTKISLSIVNVPNDFSTLQKAINAIGMLDRSQFVSDRLVQIPHVILLTPGCTYGGEPNAGKFDQQILIGNQELEFTFSKGLTITGPPRDPLFFIKNQDRSNLRDLPKVSATIKINTPNAIVIRTLKCGAIRVKNGSNVEIEDCNVSLEYYQFTFWGLYVKNSICKVTDCNFRDWIDESESPQGAAIIASGRSSVELNGTGRFGHNDVHLLAYGDSEIVIKSRGIDFEEIQLDVMQVDETFIEKQQMFCGNGKISTLFDGEEEEELETNEEPWKMYDGDY